MVGRCYGGWGGDELDRCAGEIGRGSVASAGWTQRRLWPSRRHFVLTLVLVWVFGSASCFGGLVLATLHVPACARHPQDATALFDKYHPWVNIEAMMRGLCLGELVDDDEEEADDTAPS